MSDTPETDAALYPMNQVDIVWPEFARKLERERDAAREEAHRFRSLHYSHLGINGSASWFPWEEKLNE
jgi:hypothetical protein